MNEYYKTLSDTDREEIKNIINTLYAQTFLMERYYEKRSSRYVINKLYRSCERHFDFLKEYFDVAGIELVENRQAGVMALRSSQLIAEKLSRLTTIFLLLLKMIFDEKMNMASNASHVFTTINEINEKIQLFGLMGNKPLSITEVRKTISILRRYQIIEILDDLSDIASDTRIIIYPTIHMVLNAQKINELVEKYQESEEEEHGETSGNDKDVSEQLALH